ncbi:MAG: bifunctional phosphopantothenoylcysteine decarboxylase/phosphopantothenate--cysteine ligase CoaBC [Proteobacteria bacterium]|nr:MAG: bifunctional phosphopantothenoylcysteine decarboxylase/phosphopantothenate--cysteine ligase CoaBC [Pseudomonadota bacterium]
MTEQQRVLLIIGGGIAAYKCLELIRRLREAGVQVRVILTKGGAEFVTPLSVSSLAGDKVYGDLFSLTDESEMGHIRLSREASLVVVAPATADLMAKLANGLANDLASTALLATDKPVIIAPAMNARMWLHPATQRNVATLKADGVTVIEPGSGALACGETGPGRMAEPDAILSVILDRLQAAPRPLAGRHALVTAGPTWEAIDPVRYIANRSSGKQGYAIAGALARLGARTTLISGPTALNAPAGVARVCVESARDMLAATEAALPADVAVCVAAVSDWRAAVGGGQKLKKNGAPPSVELIENPDILATLSRHNRRRPKLVVGFAAETENVVAYAQDKLARKGCDWIIANDVCHEKGVMGGECNTVHLVTANGVEDWPTATKEDVAARLAERIAGALTGVA